MISHGKNLLLSTETTMNGKDLPLKTIRVNSELVEKVLQTLTSNRSIIEQCFESDTLFDRQLQLSFQEFLNLDIGKFSMSEMLANYADKVLRKGGMKGERKLVEE